MDFFNQLAQGLGGLLNSPLQQPTGFLQRYVCLPIAFSGQDNLEDGNKVILPASALDILTRLHIEFPMLFEVENPKNGKRTHCGVMEFSAPEGTAYVPFWMMKHLLIENQEIISFKSTSLPKGTYVKFQPHETKFTELSNPRAVLEKALRMYACLTKGDIITINFGTRSFLIDIVEVRPDPAISIIETDVNVEFDPPKDYKEPDRSTCSPVIPARSTSGTICYSDEEKSSDGASDQESTPASSYFAKLSGGQRLNGKPIGTCPAKPAASLSSDSVSESSSTPNSGGDRMTSVVRGQWTYFYATDPKTHRRRLVKREPVKSGRVNAFSGRGHSLQ